jgi:nucleoside-diphosphate-sugar epimerase
VSVSWNADIDCGIGAWVKKVDRYTGEEHTGLISPSEASIETYRSGGKNRSCQFHFRERPKEIANEKSIRIEALQQEARKQFAALGPDPKYCVLLTGATGFIGKEFLLQAAVNPQIETVHCLVRPRTTIRKGTGSPLIITSQERGQALLEALEIGQPHVKKFHFITGDVEQDGFGISESDYEKLRECITHVVHAAANVSFDGPFPSAFKSNVEASRHAMAISLKFQREPRSRFISHIAIETAYVHGRNGGELAREDEPSFPHDFYNNSYEFSKALGAREATATLLGEGLRLIQIRPSIVVGHPDTGNNFGDAKVINAPIRFFAWLAYELDPTRSMGSFFKKVRAWLFRILFANFPGHLKGTINLVTVDRVVNGIVTSLSKPEAVGQPIHLAAAESADISAFFEIGRREMGISVWRVEPTTFRNIMLPIFGLMIRMKRLSRTMRLLRNVNKMKAMYANYCESGQIVFELNNDQRILGLPKYDVKIEEILTMIFRHNRYVQLWKGNTDLAETMRRERVWANVIAQIEKDTGSNATALSPEEFARRLIRHVDLHSFRYLDDRLPSRGGLGADGGT